VDDALPPQDVGVLGHAWALTVLKNVAFDRVDRFNALLRANPGLTPRVLSRRLRELCAEGILVRREDGRAVSYGLTGKGEDAAFILLALLRMSQRHPAAGTPAPTAAAATRPPKYRDG
jgi:DNA-binding HxlR family transcriptional regulator